MKTRLLILLVLAGLTVATVSPVRERVKPVLAPAARVARQGGQMALDLFANSIFRWSVQRELRAIVVELDRHLFSGGALPPEDRFSQFLRRERLGGSIDPWGGPYFLQVMRDSIFVGSEGPDTTRGTADDLRVGFSRERR